jgi:hypothetical protein
VKSLVNKLTSRSPTIQVYSLVSWHSVLCRYWLTMPRVWTLKILFGAVAETVNSGLLTV